MVIIYIYNMYLKYIPTIYFFMKNFYLKARGRKRSILKKRNLFDRIGGEL